MAAAVCFKVLYLLAQSIGLHSPSGQRMSPGSHGETIVTERKTEALLLGTAKSNTMNTILKVIPTAADVSTLQLRIPWLLNSYPAIVYVSGWGTQGSPAHFGPPNGPGPLKPI
jgi:hypothetical protein